MSRRTAEQQAADFVAANDQSPVIAGRAVHRGAERPENVADVVYTLADGSAHRLGVDAVARLFMSPYPKWKQP